MVALKKMFLVFAVLAATTVEAGPVAAGICYAGCGKLAAACFSAAGGTMGTLLGAQIAAVPAFVACNSGFGSCEAACVAALLAPTF